MITSIRIILNKKGRGFLRSTAFLIILKKNRGTLRKRPTVFNLQCVLLYLNCWAHLQYNAAPPPVAIKSEVFFLFNTKHGFLFKLVKEKCQEIVAGPYIFSRVFVFLLMYSLCSTKVL